MPFRPPFASCPALFRIACCLAAAIAGLCAESTGAAEAPPGSKGGTVEGVLYYRHDPHRAWRTARYYVKNPKSGELAEGVVALGGRSLPPAARVSPSVVTVDQKEMRFVPETLTIRAGDRVRFTNSDPQTHNISSGDVRLRFNDTIANGQEFVQAFPRPSGIARPISIGCSIHSQMQAWIYVFDHPYFRLTAADGRFRFDGLPSGDYRLEVAHAPGDLRSRFLHVESGQTQRIEIVLSPKDRRPEE